MSLLLPSIVVSVPAMLGLIAVEMVRPRSRTFGDLHWRGERGSLRYALTFDDGPTSPHTDAVLDALRDCGAKATFFVIGRNAQRHPTLIQRMHDEGHLICNHTFDHAHFGMLRLGKYWRSQIAGTDELIESIIGKRPAIFRPPMGVKSPFICGESGRLNHATVTWSIRAKDGASTTTQSILDRLVPRVRSGDIVLLHDGIEPNFDRDPRATVSAVKPLVEKLRLRGLTPARLDELLNLPAYAGSSQSQAT